jgi:pepF/M3 family oligoendopeptidase
MTVASAPESGALPRWDLTPFFPSLGSRELAAAHEGLVADIGRLVALYDHHGVRNLADRPPGAALDAADVAAFDEVLGATNDVQEQVRLVTAYLHGFISTDAHDDEATALQSRLQPHLARLRTLGTRFSAWVADLGAEPLIAASSDAAAHAWPLRKAERAAQRQMTESEEDLAAELNLSGGTAWARLHGDVTSRLAGTVERPDGTVDVLPITVVRNLAGDPDAGVRRAAYEGELAAWETVAVPLAAAYNGVKGEAVVLNRRRGWPDALEPALFHNAVDRPTLEAMQAACTASFPDFRRYLKAKAVALGHSAGSGLPWWDLLAPVGDPAAAAATWPDAVAAVDDAFGSYSPQLRALARRAISEEWVDAEAREGKRGGAFCMSVRDGESRVLLNFAGTFDSVSTLAHELGHAYHNATMAERTPMQRQTPMALAETASIFCETILVQSHLDSTPAGPEGDARRLALLDVDLTGATQVVLDIHSRFLFESATAARREERTLSVDELCGLMLDAQAETYGDGVDADARHPWMWAVKPHYYSSAFYNWPYTFGLLFGIGLFARYREEPDSFRQGYDDLLSSTGLGDAAGLAGRFGIDVRDEGFWASSLDVLRERIATYEALVARL